MNQISDVELERLIIDLKKKNYVLFTNMIGDEFFIWRPVTRKEYDIIIKSSAGDTDTKDEMICQISVLYPQVDFSTYKAGIPTMLAPVIIEESGFGSVEKTYNYLNSTRQYILNNFTSQAEIVIASAFPQYKFEEIREWSLEQLLDMVAKAEWKLNIIDGKNFVFDTVVNSDDDSNEEEPKSKEEEVRELEQDIIEAGGDPILYLGEMYKKDAKKPYTDFPFIMGSQWNNEEMIKHVGEQLRKSVSK